MLGEPGACSRRGLNFAHAALDASPTKVLQSAQSKLGGCYTGRPGGCSERYRGTAILSREIKQIIGVSCQPSQRKINSAISLLSKVAGLHLPEEEKI